MQHVNVIIADDHQLFITGLKSILNDISGYDINLIDIANDAINYGVTDTEGFVFCEMNIENQDHTCKIYFKFEGDEVADIWMNVE